MSGNRLGGERAARTNKAKHGSDFYIRIGRKGGAAKVKKGFALDHDRAVSAGRKGGQISKRRRYIKSLDEVPGLKETEGE